MAEWMATGLSRRRFQSLVDTGTLVRVRLGVYATRAATEKAKDDPRFRHAVQVAAAWEATGQNSVASHESAALLHGIALLRDPPADQVILTRPAGASNGRTRATGVVLNVAALPRADVTICQGVLVTAVARTIADLARTASFMAGVVSADHALHEQKTTKPEVTRILAAHPNWPGTAQAHRVLAFADGLAESVLESCARVVFAQEGLPAPRLQASLGGERFVGRVDFYWPRYRTVAEADGALKYRKGHEAVQQLERDQRLRADGFHVVHFGWKHVFYQRPDLIALIWRTFRGETG